MRQGRVREGAPRGSAKRLDVNSRDGGGAGAADSVVSAEEEELSVGDGRVEVIPHVRRGGERRPRRRVPRRRRHVAGERVAAGRVDTVPTNVAAEMAPCTATAPAEPRFKALCRDGVTVGPLPRRARAVDEHEREEVFVWEKSGKGADNVNSVAQRHGLHVVDAPVDIGR